MSLFSNYSFYCVCFVLPCVFPNPNFALVAKQWCWFSFWRTAKRLGQQSTCFVNHLMFFQPSLSSLSLIPAKDSSSEPGKILQCIRRCPRLKKHQKRWLTCSKAENLLSNCARSYICPFLKFLPPCCSHHQDASVKAADKSGMTLVLIAFLEPVWPFTFTHTLGCVRPARRKGKGQLIWILNWFWRNMS